MDAPPEIIKLIEVLKDIGFSTYGELSHAELLDIFEESPHDIDPDYILDFKKEVRGYCPDDNGPYGRFNFQTLDGSLYIPFSCTGFEYDDADWEPLGQRLPSEFPTVWLDKLAELKREFSNFITLKHLRYALAQWNLITKGQEIVSADGTKYNSYQPTEISIDSGNESASIRKDPKSGDLTIYLGRYTQDGGFGQIKATSDYETTIPAKHLQYLRRFVQHRRYR